MDYFSLLYLKRQYKKNVFSFFKNSFFSNSVVDHKNESSKILECIELNDHNYNTLIKKEKCYLIYGYADYSYRSLSIYTKLLSIDFPKKIINKGADDYKKIPLYKVNINNNNLLVQNFHIKSIPLIQLRYKNKLVDELSGDELNNEKNIKNILKRCYNNYFHSLQIVDNINDFLNREHELLNDQDIQNVEKRDIALRENEVLFDTLINRNDSDSKNIYDNKTDINQNFVQNELLNKLELKYQCSTYVTFKKLEMLLNEEKERKKKLYMLNDNNDTLQTHHSSHDNVNQTDSCDKNKNTILIKSFLNEIINNNKTYLDINHHYNKITAQAFLFLFDQEELSSIEKVLTLINFVKNYNENWINTENIKFIHFNEPIIVFDDFKNIHLKGFNNIDQFLSQKETVDEAGCQDSLPHTITQEHSTEITNSDNNNTISNTQIKYLSRLYRILSVKYLFIEDYPKSLHYALLSYKDTFFLNNIDSKKSKVLIENMILYLGAYNKYVIKFISQLQLLFNNKIFKKIQLPHNRTVKGGRPMIKRGKSGKWLWLSPDWKPKWLKKKTKLTLEDEWRCVPDKNVPFWN
ncbi:conserved protein, unknown function [Hepatocystis sp. ex Piliocolobus tephrosceles]|nr:conserved protein, unknown function [Hepatocystis sp. ex Piliocolobus tephrosceles]